MPRNMELSLPIKIATKDHKVPIVLHESRGQSILHSVQLALLE